VRSSVIARNGGHAAVALVLAIAGCSPADDSPSKVADLASCPSPSHTGSVQVARVAPEVEEGGVAFDVLGDGAGPGVLVCGDVLFADGNALMAMMGERDSVIERNGNAVVGARSTRIPAYRHDGVSYVSVAALAKDRRALVLQREPHRMDAVVWPQSALQHLKASGLTQGAAYQNALREGLIQ
jgi:hypothetical protein